MLEYITISGGLFGSDGTGEVDVAAIAPWVLGVVVVLLLVWFFFFRSR